MTVPGAWICGSHLRHSDPRFNISPPNTFRPGVFSSAQPSALLLSLEFVGSIGPWHQEACEFLKDRRKRSWISGNVLDKGAPLPLLLFVCRKCRRKRVGRFGRNCRPTSRKRSRDGAGEPVLDRKRPRLHS